MKLSKKDLMQRISDLIEDEDLKISVLEDMEDSIVEEGIVEEIVDESTKRELEELKWKYESLREKYKERFLKGSETDEEDEVEETEMKEKEIIDVKEI